MNIKKAGKQTKAFWRSENRFDDIWNKQGIKYNVRIAMLQGHACGWNAGVAWAKRQQKKKP